jgi:hypothetical protein
MFHTNIRKLKRQQYIKTLGYENISLKADTMEDDESIISFLKIFILSLATYTLEIRW